MTLSTHDLKKLQWHSRRGMLELDLLLKPFTEQKLPFLSTTDQQIYIQLLNCQDTDLFSWLIGSQQPVDEKLKAMVKQVIYFNTQK